MMVPGSLFCFFVWVTRQILLLIIWVAVEGGGEPDRFLVSWMAAAVSPALPLLFNFVVCRAPLTIEE